MENKILLSIIIPTKDRHFYLEKCLKSLLEIEGENYEIIVNDNSGIKFKSSLVNNTKIKYFHTNEFLTITQNFSSALDKSSGEYVSFIGDDDGINPFILKYVNFCKINNLDAGVGNVASKFIWKDVNYNLYGKKLSGILRLGKITNYFEFPNIKNELIKCAKNSVEGFGKLPKSYHGFVKRKVFNDIKLKYNSYFTGPTPDMSSSIAISLTIKKYVYFDYPIFIPGTGSNSGGGAGARHEHNWRFENIKWISDQFKNDWNIYSPKYASGITIWAECYLQTCKKINPNFLKHFNYNRYFSRLIVFDRNYKKNISNSITLFKRNMSYVHRLFFNLQLLVNVIKTIVKRLKAVLNNFLLIIHLNPFYQTVKNLNDIHECILELKKIVKKKNIKINE